MNKKKQLLGGYMSLDSNWQDYEVEIFEFLQDEGKSLTEIEEILENLREEADARVELAHESSLEDGEE